MHVIECLYYEDNPGEQDRYRRWIEMAWSKLEFACPLNIETVANYNDAREKIEKNSDKYQLLIADILEGNDDNPLGLHLIEEARERNPTIAIVALTIGGQPGTDLRTKAIDSGADDYIRKDDLDARRLKDSGLSKILRVALTKHGHEPIFGESIEDKYELDDYSLLAVIETIGIDTLKILALKLLETPITQIVLHHVSPGYSGAHVLCLDCSIKSSPGEVPRQRSILLKVSHDKYILQAEIGNKEQLNYFPSQLYANLIKDELVDATYEGDHPTKRKKWYAIGYDFLKEAKTLIDWIIEDDLESKQIHTTLKALFLSRNGLKEVYDIVRDDKERPNISLNSLITSWRKVSILKAIEDFSPLAQNFDVANEYDPEKVITFLKHKRIFECDENSFPIGTKLCRVHGDFHGSNILVNDTGIPYIIDPANICEAHWATDIARLVVDLIVSGLDSGPKSHLWDTDTCREWFTNSAAIIQIKLEYEETKTANDRILSTVSFLLNELPNIYEKCWNGHEWEFQLALAIEFLRSSYRDDISVPKRVLGLVAGCYALKTISDNQRT